MTLRSLHRLAIDIGGTFTDTVLMDPTGAIVATAKTPTTTSRPADAALEGATRVLDAAQLDWSEIGGFVHGTTLATNALIERRGAQVATITTAGFRDILEIAYERRYSQYAINIDKPDLLVPRTHALTISGRMDARGNELVALDLESVPALAEALTALGVEAVAICLMHAYANPAHERALADALKALCPELVISLSHDVSPEAREFDRLCTTIANAYIQPLMAAYLADLEARFVAQGLACPILMMTAGGGMTTLGTAARLPIRLVESGPAGGAILAARLAGEVDADAVLSFDMGGTTAKLCLIDEGRPQTARKFEIARAERFIKGSGMPVRIPVIEMIEIGAGGGSIARVDGLRRVHVGPQSAGALPGPVAFGKGGTAPTVTDADVCLGYIEPTRFAEGRLRIDRGAATTALKRELGEELGITGEDAAFGVSEIVDESMASAARMHAVESGKDLSARVMIAFGGNGPLHATRVARRSRVPRIMVPRDPGVGSAVGFLHAPVSFEIIRSRYETLDGFDLVGVNALLTDMLAEARKVVEAGAPGQAQQVRRVAFMRYHGQGHEIEIELPDHALTSGDIETLTTAFEREYARQFSRAVPGMQIEILNWAVVASAAKNAQTHEMQACRAHVPAPLEHLAIICDLSGAPRDAAIYERDALAPGAQIEGPALIIEPQSTTLVSADFRAHLDGAGNIWLTQNTGEAQ